jgi:hypothetical protein
MKQSKRQLAGSGEVLPVGVIGEIIVSASSATGTIPTGVTLGQNVGILTLTPGTWLVTAGIEFSGGTTANFNVLSISAASASIDFTSATQPQPAVAGGYQSTGNVTKILRVPANTPIYSVIRTWYTSGTSAYANMSLIAVRLT